MKTSTLNGREVVFDREPDSCPLCRRSVHPVRTNTALQIGETKQLGKSALLQIVFLCPNQACSQFFIGYYVEITDDRFDVTGAGQFRLVSTAPRVPETPHVYEGITELSPRFSSIYAQALNAEHYRLPEVAGCGLRKALEFLIKDFCIAERPDQEKAIKAMPLAACIANYVDHAGIRTVAPRAAWLGNDETHYERKWVDQDLQDLKALVALTMSWVDLHLRTKEVTKTMPSDGPTK